MKKIDRLSVFFNNGSQKRQVGTLALYQNRLAAFSYTDQWLADGFSISPFSLPLEKRVFIPEWYPFGGVHGIFNDSLPDDWGRLLVDRMLLRQGIQPETLSVLDRLAIVGSNGMGALTYEPETYISDAPLLPSDYDEISAECERILSSELSENDKQNLDAIFAAGGSSGGARPKVFAKVDDEDWIIKFPSSEDSKEIGHQEYEYNKCAQKCGITINDYRLFPSKKCSGYFGTKRFDRNYLGSGRLLMASASALLETSHRIPNLDYNTLSLLTLQLTKNNAEVEKVFRLMCFNVFSHNRDDHSKNFSWLYDEQNHQWLLSPAYDLTWSNSIGGEHATTIDGEGKNPMMENILTVAQKNGIKRSKALEIAESVKATVQKELTEWI